MADNQVFIDLVINGLQQIDHLARSISGLSASAQRAASAATPLERAEKATLAHAQASARLQVAQRNLTGAQQTLQRALSGTSSATVNAIRAQTQLAQVNARLEGRTQSLTGLFGRLQQSLLRITPASSGLSGIGEAAGLSTAALTGVAVAVAGVYGAFKLLQGLGGVLVTIGEAGIQANQQIETLRLGLATVIASAGKLSQNGVELKGIDALNAALPIAAEQFQKLRIDALQTAGTIETIGPAFQEAIGPGLAAGLGLDQIRKTVIDITNLATSIGQPLDQIGQELRALFEGQIDKNARIAKVLGITKEDIENAREAGKLAEFLNEKLAVAAASGKLVAQTFAGAKSKLQEAASVFAGTVTEGLFNTLRDKLNEILPQVFDTSKANLVSDAFAGIADALTQVFNVAGELLSDAIDSVVAGVKQVSAFLKDNRETVSEIITGVGEIVRQVVGLVADIVVGNSNTKAWKETFSVINTITKTIAVSLAFVRDLVGLVRNAAVLAGSALADAMLTPLATGAQLVAELLSAIPGIGDAAKVAADSLTSLANIARANAGSALDGLRRGFREFGNEAERSLNRIQKPGGTGGIDFPRDPNTKVTGRAPRKDAATQERLLSPPDERSSRKALRDAELALQRQQDEARLQATLRSLEAQRVALSNALKDQQTSYEEYYAAITELDKKALAAQKLNLQLEKAAEEKAILEITADRADALERINQKARREAAGKSPAQQSAIFKAALVEQGNIERQTEADKTRHLTKIAQLDAEAAKADDEFTAKSLANARERLEQQRQLAEEFQNIALEARALSGDEFGAQIDRVTKDLQGKLSVAIKNFGKDSQEAAAALALLQARLDQLGQSRLEVQLSSAETNLGAARQSIQNAVNEGLLSEIKARQLILELEKAQKAALLAILDQQSAIVDKLQPGIEKDAANAKLFQARVQIEALGVDPLFAQIRSGLENDLSGAFFDFLLSAEKGLASLKDLALGFVNGFRRAVSQAITNEFEKAVVEPLTRKFLKFLGLGGESSNSVKVSPDTVANTTATTANTVAIEGLTAAIAVQSATNATGQITDVVGQGAEAISFEGAVASAGASGGPAGAVRGIVGSIGGAIKGFANGIRSVVGSIGGGLKSILGSILGFAGSLIGTFFGGAKGFAGASAGAGAGFAEGGFTPAIPTNAVAGVVHGGEWVAPAWMVSHPAMGGVIGALEGMRRGAWAAAVNAHVLSSIQPSATPGYAMGGLVAPAAATGGAVNVNLRNVTVFDPSEIENVLNTPTGEQIVLNHIKRRSATIRQLIGA